MKIKIVKSLTILLVSLFCIPNLASGTFTLPWYENGQWGDPYNTGNPLTQYSFDKIEAFVMTPGHHFEINGMENFNPPSWSGGLVNPIYAVATGPLNNVEVQWESKFSGNLEDGFRWDNVVWSGSTIVGAAQYVYDSTSERIYTGGTGPSRWWQPVAGIPWFGFEFTLANGELPQYNRASIPEPCTMIFLGFGLVGIIGFGRKKLKGMDEGQRTQKGE